MLHAPSRENKQQHRSTPNQFTAESGQELHPALHAAPRHSSQWAHLHSIYGNQAVLRALSRPAHIQPKHSPGSLRIGSNSPGSALRSAGTDNLDETDTTIPHATGDAGVSDAGVRDAGADAGTPASCCDRAFSAGLAGTDYGGVICCTNVKNSCVWPSNFSAALTNATARTIAATCALAHEDTHHDDIDCTGAAVERPGFKAGKNARAEECTAYRAEAACLTNHFGDCGGDATCTSQTTSRRDTKKQQAADNCS